MEDQQRSKSPAPLWLALGSGFLFLLNAFVVRELFQTEYTRHMRSIEGAYITIARYILGHGPGVRWFPLWYAGIPFQNSYPPLLPMLTAGIARLFGISPALSYHAVVAAAYSLGAATLFLMAYRLSRSLTYSFLAGLLFSSVSPASGSWSPRRLQVMVQDGEGGHVLALALIPVAILLLDVALSSRRPHWYFLAALAMAATVLANWIGAFALAVAVFCYLLCCLPDWRAWATSAGLAVYAYLLALPWIPPSTIAAIQANSAIVEGSWPMAPALKFWFPFLAVAAILYWLLKSLALPMVLQFSALFFSFMGGITLAWYWAHIYLVPQPHRYHLELEMGAVLSLAFAAKWLARRITARRTVHAAILVVLVLICARGLVRYRKSARGMNQSIDIHSTVEYRVARWLDSNMPGDRVLMPGSISQWQNAFTDTPQLAGAFDQGITNPFLPDVLFQIFSGLNAGPRAGQIAVTWLKAFGVRAVGVSGPASTEQFKPFRDPHKFDGLLRELWRSGDDVIYEVSPPAGSLAHAVHSGDLVARRPETALDTVAVEAYLRALNDPSRPPARFRWKAAEEAEVIADLNRGDLLSLSINYHPGWQATVNGSARPLRQDGLGLMAVDPDCQGPCTVLLRFDGGAEMHGAGILAMLAWIAGILAMAGIPLFFRLRRRMRV